MVDDNLVGYLHFSVDTAPAILARTRKCPVTGEGRSRDRFAMTSVSSGETKTKTNTKTKAKTKTKTKTKTIQRTKIR